MTKEAIIKLFGYKAGRKLYNLLYSSCANFCCIVKNCLGISSSGNIALYLNQQGDWVPASGPQGLVGLFAQTANSSPITGTTVETTLINGGVGTLSVPANGFQVGDSFRAIFGGVMSVANNQTIRIRIRTNGSVLLDSGVQPITNITNGIFSLNIDFTIRQLGGAGTASIVSLGTFHYNKTSNAAVEGFGFNVVNNTTFNTTINNTLDVTVQWGSNNAGNNIYSDIFILNKTY
jgi:hypothetical protein